MRNPSCAVGGVALGASDRVSFVAVQPPVKHRTVHVEARGSTDGAPLDSLQQVLGVSGCAPCARVHVGRRQKKKAPCERRLARELDGFNSWTRTYVASSMEIFNLWFFIHIEIEMHQFIFRCNRGGGSWRQELEGRRVAYAQHQQCVKLPQNPPRHLAQCLAKEGISCLLVRESRIDMPACSHPEKDSG